VAPGRGRRPGDVAVPTTACPFSPGNEALTPPSLLPIRDEGAADAWFVRVAENLFPVAAGQGRHPPTLEDALFRSTQAVGAHEVVIETRHHDEEMAMRGPAQLTQPAGLPGSTIDSHGARRHPIRGRLQEQGHRSRHLPAPSPFPDHRPGASAAVRPTPRPAGTPSFSCIRHLSLCDLVQAERHNGERVIL
jgi:hypothetical protein